MVMAYRGVMHGKLVMLVLLMIENKPTLKYESEHLMLRKTANKTFQPRIEEKTFGQFSRITLSLNTSLM